MTSLSTQPSRFAQATAAGTRSRIEQPDSSLREVGDRCGNSMGLNFPTGVPPRPIAAMIPRLWRSCSWSPRLLDGPHVPRLLRT
jgi:hypothetical protein